MQVGQILVEQRWVEPDNLARALAEQAQSGRRICSLLISRGQLDPDNAARALANQHNVPGVLQRHLDNRDQALAALLPPALARACFALPIGRTRNQELIVCVRDPRPELRGIIASAVGGPVVIAVAPAYQLEQLIKRTYEVTARPAGPVSFEVDLSTRQIATIPDPAALAAAAAPAPARESDEVEVDLRTRQIAVIGDGLGEFGTMTLVELDDARVTKDPSQSGQQAAVLPRTTTTLYSPPGSTTGPHPAIPRTMSTQYPGGAQSPTPRAPATQFPGPRTMTLQNTRQAMPTTSASGTPGPPRTTTAPQRSSASNVLGMGGPTLDATIAVIDRAGELDDAVGAAMSFLAGRFRHAVLFMINEGAALGDRGHGGQLTEEVIQAITVPLSAPSIVQVAYETRRLATAAPPDAGAIQDRLERTLGNPQSLAAVPIEVDDDVAYVIAAGEAHGDPVGAAYDLERLGRVLGAAYQRLR